MDDYDDSFSSESAHQWGDLSDASISPLSESGTFPSEEEGMSFSGSDRGFFSDSLDNFAHSQSLETPSSPSILGFGLETPQPDFVEYETTIPSHVMSNDVKKFRTTATTTTMKTSKDDDSAIASKSRSSPVDRSIKLEKNRIAAQKSRRKKKTEFQSLQCRNVALLDEISRLRSLVLEHEKLHGRLDHAPELLQKKDCGCQTDPIPDSSFSSSSSLGLAASQVPVTVPVPIPASTMGIGNSNNAPPMFSIPVSIPVQFVPVGFNVGPVVRSTAKVFSFAALVAVFLLLFMNFSTSIMNESALGNITPSSLVVESSRRKMHSKLDLFADTVETPRSGRIHLPEDGECSLALEYTPMDNMFGGDRICSAFLDEEEREAYGCVNNFYEDQHRLDGCEDGEIVSFQCDAALVTHGFPLADIDNLPRSFTAGLTHEEVQDKMNSIDEKCVDYRWPRISSLFQVSADGKELYKINVLMLNMAYGGKTEDLMKKKYIAGARYEPTDDVAENWKSIPTMSYGGAGFGPVKKE